VQTVELRLSPQDAANDEAVTKAASIAASVKHSDIIKIQIVRRSIDARSRNILILLKVNVYVKGDVIPETDIKLKNAELKKDAEPVYIIGAGPAGLFAALECLDQGMRPVIIERGKNVRERRRDLAAITREQKVNPDSNYCFGEGGAGTYSDGKLYTRSTKRGDVNEILRTLVRFGADESILIDAHPHIGTNKLPKLIENIREYILSSGGEIHFNERLIDIEHKNNELVSITTQYVIDGEERTYSLKKLILATGHSARDVFELLHRKNILIEAKPFALGVRIEHPQALIDASQYHCSINDVEKVREFLPAASYSLVTQAKERGVYSFCMCPGGIIAPCATKQDEIVTNGWSPSKRNNPYANSGTVVEIREEDWKKFSSHGPLAALRYQQAAEHAAWEAGGKTQTAPAQRMIDFVNKKISADLPDCSYQPGIVSRDLWKVLPEGIAERLAIGVKEFGKKMRGYYTNDAVLVAVESRTSSPVRIPRDRETLEHPQIKGLYPCAEGAGYAGGIISAAIDGVNCARKLGLARAFCA
jgi:uncharacterized protein